MLHWNHSRLINGSPSRFKELQRNTPGRHICAYDVRLVVRQFEKVLICHLQRKEWINMRIRVCPILTYKVPAHLRPAYTPWAELLYTYPFWEVVDIQLEPAPIRRKRVRILWDENTNTNHDLRALTQCSVVDVSASILRFIPENAQ